MELEDLIKYENESTYLDFKRTQYQKVNFVSLIKDIMSMANADIKESTRYIIIGVEHKSSGQKKIIGIKPNEFIDPATYQQVTQENIDGKLTLEYNPFTFKNKTLGIFKISNCNDKPYMMKKDYKTLKKGDSFIRKGTHQCRLLKSDLDKIIKEKTSENIFSGEIEICFSKNRKKEIKLAALSEDFIFPSEEAASSIRNSIKYKIESESYPEKGVDLGELLNDGVDHIKAKEIIEHNLESRGKKLSDFPDIEKLLDDLNKVKDGYREEDEYELFENNSYKINLDILNKGNNYIKDATIELKFKKNYLAVRISEVEEPKSYYPLGIKMPNLHPVINKYPDIEYQDEYIKVFYEIGDIKHHIENKNIFDVPIRFVLGRNLLGKKLIIDCMIHGENVPIPFKEVLTIKII